MKISYYKLAAFILGLSLITGIIQSLLFLQIGNQFYFLDSYTFWFWGMLVLTLAGEIFLLKYFYHKKFWFSFWAGIVASMIALGVSLLVYKVIVLMAKDLEGFLTPSNFVAMGAALLFGLSLVFSKAGKKPWLRIAGIYIVIFQLFFVGNYLIAMNLQDSQIKNILETIFRWGYLGYNLFPVFFILHFLREIKSMRADTVDIPFRKSIRNPIAALGVFALFFSLIFATSMAKETYWFIQWGKESYKEAQAMAQQFEARTFVSKKGDTLHYRFLKPLEYDLQKKYPLVVCLHGGINHGTDNIWQLSTSPAPLLSSETNRKKYPAFLFVPQCPTGTIWWEKDSSYPYPSADSLVLEAIQALEEEFTIDEQRRYLVGASGGGYGSWHFISTRPELFAAAIPVCGAGNPQLAARVVDIPVWAFHGEKDRNVPVSGSRDMIEAIKKAGGNPKYTEFPNEGHGIWEKVEATPDILDWLFAQKKE